MPHPASLVKQMAAAVESMDPAAVQYLITHQPRALATVPDNNRGGWVAHAMFHANSHQIPARQLIDVLTLLNPSPASDPSGKGLLSHACLLNQPEVFLWLLDQGYRLGGVDSRRTWLDYSFVNPDWLDSAALAQQLRRDNDKISLGCLMGLLFFQGKTHAEIKKLWPGYVLYNEQFERAFCDQFSPLFYRMEGLLLSGKIPLPSLDIQAWDFFCKEIGESVILAQCRRGLMDKIRPLFDHRQLESDTAVALGSHPVTRRI